MVRASEFLEAAMKDEPSGRTVLAEMPAEPRLGRVRVRDRRLRSERGAGPRGAEQLHLSTGPHRCRDLMGLRADDLVEQ